MKIQRISDTFCYYSSLYYLFHPNADYGYKYAAEYRGVVGVGYGARSAIENCWNAYKLIEKMP